MTTFRQPADGYAFPAAFMRPPLMAIGDSMYNGMRSATINAEFAAKSVPAAVSRVIDPAYPFRAPRYPEAILLDVEQLCRDINIGDLFDKLRERLASVAANGRRWANGDHDLPLDHAAWDNLAQAGAEIVDLTDRSWTYWDNVVRTEAPKLQTIQTWDDLEGSNLSIIDLHMALNGRYLLNPNAREELKHLAPIDLVNARKPKHLIVNIGANHGLIDLTLFGDTQGGLAGLRDWAAQMTDLAGKLSALGPETETIHINAIPLPSDVPNQMPLYNPGVIDPNALPRHGRYFPVYDNRLGWTDDYTKRSAQEMKALDREVAAIIDDAVGNARAVFAARNDDRLGVFRMDRALRAYDGKHHESKKIRQGDPGVRLEHPRRAYSNMAINFHNFFVWDDFREGGLGSLDNHHPSGLGYSVLTRELLREMKKKVPGISLANAKIGEQGDRLFSDEPGAYATLVDFLYEIRRRGAGLPGKPDMDEADGDTPAPRPAAAPADDDERAACALAHVMCGVLSRR